MSIFNDKSLKSVAEIAAKIMQAEATHPKTEKEKQLAALGHPKDKITHKDVLIGRGVLKKEEVQSHQAKTTMKHVTNPTAGEKKAAKDIKPGIAGYRDRVAMLKSAEARGALKKEETEQIEEGKVKQMAMDTKEMGDSEFKKQYGFSKPGTSTKPVNPDWRATHAKVKEKLAASAAKRQGVKEDVEQVDEGWNDMLKASKERQGPQPSGGAGVKQGTRYGGGRQKDAPEQEEEKPARRKYGARQNYKRSARVNEGFTEMLEKYDEVGLRAFVTLEEEPDNEQFTRELEDQKASMEGKKKQPNVAAASTQGVKQMPEEVEVFDADEINGTTVETIEERSLSEPETAKKEKIVKSMKKGISGFKARYGDRAKSVMYATATKLAKKG